MANWFVKVGMEERGPFVDAQLRQLALNGQLRSTMLVRREGSDRLVEAGTFKGLFPPAAPVPPTPPPPPPPSSPAIASPVTVKQLQLTDLPAAERAIGVKAFELSIDRVQFQKPYEKLRRLAKDIGKAEADLAVAGGKVAKFAASATLKASTSGRDQLLEELGRKIRLSPSDAAAKKLSREIASAQAIADQLAKLGGKPKYHPGPIAIAATVAVLFCIVAIAVATHDPQRDPKNWGGGESRKFEAIVAAENAVKSTLNFPNEASFPWGGAITVPLSREYPYWSVSSEVTGKNAFGVSITNDWSAEVYRNPQGKWECLKLVMGTETAINRPLPAELKQILAVEEKKREAEFKASVKSSRDQGPAQENILADFSEIPPPVIREVQAGKQVWELIDADIIQCKQSTFYVILDQNRIESIVTKYWIEESLRIEEFVGWSEISIPSETEFLRSDKIIWSAEDLRDGRFRITHKIVMDSAVVAGVAEDQIDVKISPSGTSGQWTNTHAHTKEIKESGLKDVVSRRSHQGVARLMKPMDLQ